MRVSIVVPVLNEEAALPALLDLLGRLGAYEVILVDGGSRDRTRAIALERGVRVLDSVPGRGVQLNTGAALATGDVLLFLHADAELRPGALEALRQGLADGRRVGGVFDVRFLGGDWVAECFNWIYHWRRYWGIFYGDAGIFVRQEVFLELGGFPAYPIMEDYEFGRRLFRRGPLAFLDEPIVLSDRRWRKDGLLKTLFIWVLMQTAFSLGIPAERLARFYRQVR